jgi:hypothetical protein
VDCGSQRVQRRAGYSTAAQQLLALVEWSAAWFGVAVSMNAPLFLTRLTLQPESPPTLAVWNAVSTRFPAVCTHTWPGHHVARCLL